LDTGESQDKERDDLVERRLDVVADGLAVRGLRGRRWFIVLVELRGEGEAIDFLFEFGVPACQALFAGFLLAAFAAVVFEFLEELQVERLLVAEHAAEDGVVAAGGLVGVQFRLEEIERSAATAEDAVQFPDGIDRLGRLLVAKVVQFILEELLAELPAFLGGTDDLGVVPAATKPVSQIGVELRELFGGLVHVGLRGF
jgi:hypothetical protein